jgi:hypothetical protein
MMRETEELCGLSIGSPVPTPRPDDADGFAIVNGTLLLDGDSSAAGDINGSRSSPFPAVTVRMQSTTRDEQKKAIWKIRLTGGVGSAQRAVRGLRSR